MKGEKNIHALFAHNSHFASTGWKRRIQNKHLNDSSERKKRRIWWERITTTTIRPMKMTTQKVNTSTHSHTHTHNKHKIGSWSYECQVIFFSCKNITYKMFCWGHSLSMPRFLPHRIRWNDLHSLRLYIFILFCHSWARALDEAFCGRKKKMPHTCVCMSVFVSTRIFLMSFVSVIVWHFCHRCCCCCCSDAA